MTADTLFTTTTPHCLLAGEVMVELSRAEPGLFRQSFAGDVYNTAVYLKRCLPACEVSMLTAVGRDPFSMAMKQAMGDEGINTGFILTHTEKGPGLYAIHTDASGERSFQYWRNDAAAREWVTLWQQTLTGSEPSPLPQADLIYLSGITLAVLDETQRALLFDWLHQARESGTRVAFDPNYRPQLWASVDKAAVWTRRAYRIADIAFPGMDEHKLLFGHKDCFDVMDIVAGWGVKEVVAKNGTDQIRVLFNETMVTIPVTPVAHVVDTTSAGDGFTGGYLAARLDGKSVRQAAQQGADVAATIIRFPGAIVPEPAFTEALNRLRDTETTARPETAG